MVLQRVPTLLTSVSPQSAWRRFLPACQDPWGNAGLDGATTPWGRRRARPRSATCPTDTRTSMGQPEPRNINFSSTFLEMYWKPRLPGCRGMKGKVLGTGGCSWEAGSLPPLLPGPRAPRAGPTSCSISRAARIGSHQPNMALCPCFSTQLGTKTDPAKLAATPTQAGYSCHSRKGNACSPIKSRAFKAKSTRVAALRSREMENPRAPPILTGTPPSH